MRNIALVQQKSVTKSLYLMDIIGGMTWKESEKLPQRYTACSVATIFSGIRLQKRCELEQRRANARLEKYKRADEAKIRELMLAQEQLTMENAKKKGLLEKEATSSSRLTPD